MKTCHRSDGQHKTQRRHRAYSRLLHQPPGRRPLLRLLGYFAVEQLDAFIERLRQLHQILAHLAAEAPPAAVALVRADRVGSTARNHPAIPGSAPGRAVGCGPWCASAPSSPGATASAGLRGLPQMVATTSENAGHRATAESTARRVCRSSDGEPWQHEFPQRPRSTTHGPIR